MHVTLTDAGIEARWPPVFTGAMAVNVVAETSGLISSLTARWQPSLPAPLPAALPVPPEARTQAGLVPLGESQS